MVDTNWNDDRILLTPVNLYFEYLLLQYNNYLKDKLEDVQITHGELTYIYNIKYYDNVSQKDIAENLLVSEANVAKMVKKLVDKGLVVKTKDENNKSRNILSLTEKGEEIFVKINIFTCGWERNITKNLTNNEYYDLKQKLYKITEESVNHE